MSRRVLRSLLFFVAAFYFSSCSTFPRRSYQAVEEIARAGKFSESVKSYKKIKQSNNNAIQWKFDLALLEHFAGQYDESITLMNEVHNLMEDSVTKSITQGIGVAVLNDNVAAYSSTAYEYLFVNAFNALNYYHIGNFEEAIVEVRRIGNKQREYLAKYGEAIKADAKDVSQKLQGDSNRDAETLGVNLETVNSKSPAKPKDEDIYRDSSFARYVSMMFRMMSGDTDNARVDARALALLNSNMAVDEVLAIATEKTKGRIDFLAFGGLIAQREEKRIYFPGDFSPLPFIKLNIGGIDIPAFRIKFAYPVYNAAISKNNVASVRVTLSNGVTKVLPLLENFSRAVEMDVATKASSTFARSVIRSLTKKAVAVTSGAVTLFAAKQALAEAKGKEKRGITAELVYALAYAGVVSAIEAVDATESADIRQCLFLPGATYAGGISLEAGTYSGKIQYLNSHGKILHEEKFTNITVKNGKTILMESAWLQ